MIVPSKNVNVLNFFFLGGGFALSEAAKKEYSDLNGKIGELLKTMSTLPTYFIILLIIIFTVFITNFASNVAVCNVITPIVMQLVSEFPISLGHSERAVWAITLTV